MRMSDEEILEALRSGIQYKQLVQVRGLQIPMRPLTLGETNEVEQDVKMQFMREPEEKRTALLESTIRAKATLRRCTTSAPGETDAFLTAAVIDKMTNDEAIAIHKEYMAVVDRVNPSYEALPLERIEELVGILKKSPDEKDTRSALMQFSFQQLVSLASHLLTTSGE